MILEIEAWRRWRRRAYGYREVAIATLAFGIFLHLSRLVFGVDAVQRQLLLPRVDEAFGLVMGYAAVAGVSGWRALRFRSEWHRRISMFILGFIIVSIPVHVGTFLRDSAARLSALPWWYSLVEGALLYPAFVISVWNIRYAVDAFDQRAESDAQARAAAKYPYATHLDIKFPALTLVDVPALVRQCTDAWYNQTLCRVNDSVVRLGVMQGEYHWHKHENDDEFFFVLSGLFVVEVGDRSVELRPQQGFMVPKGIVHRTRAPVRSTILMIESAAIIPTGDA